MFVLGPNKDIKYHRLQGCGSRLIAQVFRNAYNDNVSNNKIKPVEVCVIRNPWKRLLCLFGQYKNQWTLDTSLTIDWDHHIWLPQYKRRWHNTNIVYFKYNTKVVEQICLLFREKNVIIREEDWPNEILHITRLNYAELEYIESHKTMLLDKFLQKDIDFYNSLSYHNE